MEQLHKIFKLCGSPSEEYWKKSKLSHAIIFKPQQPYTRVVSQTFNDFPSSALSLLDVLLAVEPRDRGTASLALQHEVIISCILSAVHTTICLEQNACVTHPSILVMLGAQRLFFPTLFP